MKYLPKSSDIFLVVILTFVILFSTNYFLNMRYTDRVNFLPVRTVILLLHFITFII